MNPRKIRTWAGRLLLSTGIVLTIFLGAPGAASASDDNGAHGTTVASSSAAASTAADPTWG